MDDDDAMDIPPELDRRNPKEVDNPTDASDQPEPSSPPSNADEIKTEEAPAPPSETAVLKAHPFANLFPMMQGKEFGRLVASIRKDGLEEPIVTPVDKILVGCNRFAACTEAKVEPTFIAYEGTDPLGYVLRKNLHRRTLNTSHRALVAASLTNLKQGQRADTLIEVSAITINQAAETLNVGRASVERAKIVLASGNEELIDAVMRGEMSISAAMKFLKEPNAPPENEDELQCKRLLKLWDKTGPVGQAMFREAIGGAT